MSKVWDGMATVYLCDISFFDQEKKTLMHKNVSPISCEIWSDFPSNLGS